MDSVSTNDVFYAIKGQLEQVVGDDVDDIIIYDGPLSAAIEDHFSGARQGSTFIFLTLTSADADAQSGYGLPVREALLTDIYIVSRVVGRGRYDETREAFWDLSDAIVHDAFSMSNRLPDTLKAFHGSEFISRTRQNQRGDVLAHLIRFAFTPARAT